MSAVRFVDVPNMIRWVSDRGAEAIIAEMAAVVEADFGRWSEFEKAPRVASHSPGGVIELMPTSDGQSYGFKFVNGHPNNPLSGLQTVTAFGVLADVVTGYPRFVAEMTIMTALRTAATSAMAARHLARPDSAVMALIGTGSQAEFQSLGFRALLGINTLRVWDTDPAAMTKFARNAAALGFEVHVASSASDAVSGADIVTICTADKANAVVLTDAMVVPGMHLNAIGGDCPGKTSSSRRSCRARGSSSSSSRRPGSRARFSTSPPTSRSPSSGRSSTDRRPDGRVPRTSPSSTRWGSRSRTSPRCGTPARPSRAPTTTPSST